MKDSNFKPLLLLTVNNSIGNKSRHFTESELKNLLSAPKKAYSDIEKYVIETIRSEATQIEKEWFCKKYKIPVSTVDNILDTL